MFNWTFMNHVCAIIKNMFKLKLKMNWVNKFLTTGSKNTKIHKYMKREAVETYVQVWDVLDYLSVIKSYFAGEKDSRSYWWTRKGLSVYESSEANQVENIFNWNRGQWRKHTNSDKGKQSGYWCSHGKISAPLLALDSCTAKSPGKREHRCVSAG